MNGVGNLLMVTMVTLKALIEACIRDTAEYYIVCVSSQWDKAPYYDVCIV